ncbi:chromatin structure-remodeling complex subunit RSC1/2, partial [Tremellales sp. Uapishka_1]
MPPRKAGPSRRVLSPPPQPYPGQVDGRGMDEGYWEVCREILEEVYKAKDATRRVAEIFVALPDRKLYPDYFEAIPEPECLENIQKQLNEQGYDEPEDFFKQLHLVFLNAKHYNEEGSLVWQDAKRLEDQIHLAWKTKAAESRLPNQNPYHRNRNTKMAPRKSKAALPPPPPAPTAASAPRKSTTPAVATPPVGSITLPAPIDSPAPGPARSGAQVVEDDKKMMAAMDARLPRWTGPEAQMEGPSPGGIPGSGWFGEGAPDYERHAGGKVMWPHRIRSVVAALSGYRDKSGFRLAEVLMPIPPVSKIPFLSSDAPVSFPAITTTAQSGKYSTLLEFDMEMTRLFEKARRWYTDGSAEYGHVVTLQRLYNALTAPYPMSLSGTGIPEPSATLFASLPAGPGNARSMHETNLEIKAGAQEDEVGFGVTTYRVGTRDRIFTDEARHKGMAYKIGDYVHLINPDDATRPIIGQIFKTFVPTNGYRTHHVTVCWYYRPEQTVHTPDRLFFDREAFKSGHFCDHPVEDIIERVSCQFFVKVGSINSNTRLELSRLRNSTFAGDRRIRSTIPAGHYVGVGSPDGENAECGTDICNSRYNDREYLCVKIKNWNSCIPDELRQSDFMRVVPFEHHVELGLMKSPFLRGIKGPGFFGEPRKSAIGAAGPEGGLDDEDKEPRKRRDTRQHPVVDEPLPPAPSTLAQAISYPPQGTPVMPVSNTAARTPVAPTTSSLPLPTSGAGPSRMAPLPRQQPAPPANPFLPRPQAPQTAQWQTPAPPPSSTRTSMAFMMGGFQAMEQNASREILPVETANLFEKDQRQQVLWFSGPPLAPGTIPIPDQLPHSLEYLTYLTKRKRGMVDNGHGKKLATVENGANEVAFLSPAPAEPIEVNDAWWAEGLSEDQVFQGLKGVS